MVVAEGQFRLAQMTQLMQLMIVDDKVVENNMEVYQSYFEVRKTFCVRVSAVVRYHITRDRKR